MKPILLLLSLCLPAFAQVPTVADLKVALASDNLPGRVWAKVENWAAQQIGAAQADKQAAVDAVAAEKAAAEAARLALITATKAALADADAAKAKAAAVAVVAAAEAPQREKELIALEQQKSEIQAKIDALNAQPVKSFLPKLKSNTAPKKKK